MGRSTLQEGGSGRAGVWMSGRSGRPQGCERGPGREGGTAAHRPAGGKTEHGGLFRVGSWQAGLRCMSTA